ncbi:uncharacterized protein LOC111628113 [Centruroides sculpturatus]|uniref:uncharacterized protein LOC111628113 n=1 Tax=Centruroides sculpturatus TaxID=218467 RepID=UPI000C6C8B1D|nr:uncharacterized protein LOC111628113 [Centruroides sculpturatus]
MIVFRMKKELNSEKGITVYNLLSVRTLCDKFWRKTKIKVSNAILKMNNANYAKEKRKKPENRGNNIEWLRAMAEAMRIAREKEQQRLRRELTKMAIRAKR